MRTWLAPLLVLSIAISSSGLGACASGGDGGRDSGRTATPDARVVGFDAPFPRDTGPVPDANVRPDTGAPRDAGSTCTPACDTGETCVSGTCRCGAGAACTGTQTCCGGGCVDTRTNAAHCGMCGMACPAGRSCTAGSCELACTVSCPAGTTCMGTQCLCGTGAGARACSGGETCCSGSCTRTDTVANCGACGRVCSGSQSCCSGTCRDTQNDESNCGSCGNACDDTADGCTAGNCTCGGGPECFIMCAPFIGCFPA